MGLAPPMIPSRPVLQVEQRRDTVQERLARLRAEQSARDRPRYGAVHANGQQQQQQTTGPRWLQAATNAANAASSEARPLRVLDRRRGTAGPPAPKSWATTMIPSGGNDCTSRRSSRLQPHEVGLRERLATPLSTAEPPAAQVKGLFTAAGKVVAEELARNGGDDGLLAEYVHYLPLHLRLRLLEVFADWRNDLVLDDDALRLLLPCEGAGTDSARASADDGGDQTTISRHLENVQLEEGNVENSAEAEDDWDALPQHGDGVDSSEVQNLNLAFSAVSLRTLRAVLLREVDASGPPPVRLEAVATIAHASKAATGPSLPPPLPRYVAAFPFLHTLNLTATTRIPNSDSFFDLLSHLISLRTLSLSGRSLSLPGSNVTPVGFLARLAAATPTLQSLNLSYVEMNAVSAVQAVDWDERWLDLRVLGLRRDYPEQVSAARLRQRLKRDVWDAITLDRRKKRRWIDIVT
ncbi:hypothetical protein JCM10908_000565 [Rhodotorula pacifica]|uniref:uncharacterized protein n=1 Tax=Rhodotorula pacifica TaxID=1495444 RepID=UPI003178C89C